MDLQKLRICHPQRLDLGLKRVSWVGRYQGQCRALRPLGHQGYRLRNYKKDPPLCSGYYAALELFEPFENFLSPYVVVVHKILYYVHKNGMSDEHLRCFWPFFAPFVVHFLMVHT